MFLETVELFLESSRGYLARARVTVHCRGLFAQGRETLLRESAAAAVAVPAGY